MIFFLKKLSTITINVYVHGIKLLKFEVYFKSHIKIDYFL